MITIKKIDCVSQSFIEAFNKEGQKEWDSLYGQTNFFYRQMKRLWEVRYQDAPFCVIGVVDRSLIGNGLEVCILLCKKAEQCLKTFILFALRAFSLLVRLLGRVVISIDPTNVKAQRLAEFFTFNFSYKVSETLHVYELTSWPQRQH
jgi:hypothetical protein